MNQKFKTLILWALPILLVIALSYQFLSSSNFDSLKSNGTTVAPRNSAVARVSYGRFLDYINSGRVTSVDIFEGGRNAVIETIDSDLDNKVQRLRVDLPGLTPELINILKNEGISFDVHPIKTAPPALGILGNLLFPAILIGGLILLARRSNGMPGGPGQAMQFGKTKARFAMEAETGVVFDDVAGVNEAKQDLQEVVTFLKKPEKFTSVGARIPKGVLLVGPPGTGKTLLAKAIAGEAGVPFFSLSGSEFVEMFVGVGASRVRDLFKRAKENSPCLIFIDEIDAVGRQRGAGIGGGNDEREQTLNQLLTEMDGFEGNSGIIIIAATNRPDVLDSALMRPGRFDRQVTVDRPDYAGRLQILNVHAKDKTLSKDVDLDKVARRTPGFTGADLANLLNEAAILAARKDLDKVSNDEVGDAIERVMAGPEKKDRVISDKKKELVAYHEAGHALVGALMPDYDPVAKVSIIPRGQAGGLTFFTPSEERMESGLYSRSYLQNQMAVALGGRVAEEIVYGEEEVTTGASNDLQQVANVARQMITKFGMSDKIGPVALGQSQGGMFLGRDMSSTRDFSEDTAATIDVEVSELVDVAYKRATKVLTENRTVLDEMAQMLIERETIDTEDIQDLLNRSEVKVANYI